MSPLRLVCLGLVAAFMLTAGCAYHASDGNYQDIGVIKADTGGATLWDRTVDSGYTDYLSRISALSNVVSAADGRVFVGYHLMYGSSSNLSMPLGWISSLGPDGERLWDWGVNWMPHDFSPTTDGGCIVVAETYDNGVVKIGPDGRTMWMVFESTLSFEPTAVASIATGRYIVGGKEVFSSNEEIFLAWIDENGAVLDVKTYAGEDIFLRYVNSIIPTTDGGCAVVEDSSERPRLTRLDAGGNVLWNISGLFPPAEIEGSRRIMDVREVEGGGLGLIVVETRSGVDTTRVRDVVYGPDGAVLKEQVIFIPQDCSITWAPDGGYVFAALEGDDGNLSAYAAHDGSSYVHLVKLNATGHQEWDRTVGSKPDIHCLVTIDPAGDDGYVIMGERDHAH